MLLVLTDYKGEKMDQWNKFEDMEHLHNCIVENLEAGTLEQKDLEEPNWGVSPFFLLEAGRNEIIAKRASWLMPTLFLAGFLLGYFL
jgi:hypothetical protein|tara:strand:+ start:980 stop:1240 length:261 start_codon:yes stop_codon:yes gene_type:complete